MAPRSNMKRGSWIVLALALVVGIGVTGWNAREAPAQPEQPQVRPAQPAQPGQPVQRDAERGVPKYTVVESEGVSLLVVDNTSNTLYFYTCDEGKEAGAELRLRGSIDLNQVGRETISAKGQPQDAQPKDRDPRMGDR